MTKRKQRELAKAQDKKPKWNAVNGYKLTDLTEEQAKAKGEVVYKVWRQVAEGKPAVPLHERTNIFKI
jgi:hypothetical protein